MYNGFRIPSKLLLSDTTYCTQESKSLWYVLPALLPLSKLHFRKANKCIFCGTTMWPYIHHFQSDGIHNPQVGPRHWKSHFEILQRYSHQVDYDKRVSIDFRRFAL